MQLESSDCDRHKDMKGCKQQVFVALRVRRRRTQNYNRTMSQTTKRETANINLQSFQCFGTNAN